MEDPAQRKENEDEDGIRPTVDAPDPSGGHANTPGRTGRPPGEGPEHPADETVPSDS